MSQTRLRMQHHSLQFSDTPRQQEHDIKLLFKEGLMFPIKTGTEAGLDRTGGNMNRPLLEEYAEKFDHVIHFARDNWIAVDRAIIQPGSLERGQVFVLDKDETKGRGHDSVMATLAFDHVIEEVGRINQGAVHYPTQGREKGDPNWDENREYAEAISKWMDDMARGRGLAFVNGDFNMPDPKTDWAFNGLFTSMADELRAWEGTGHGPIDGFASYDRDGRVMALKFEVLDDRESFRFSDHYVCRGTWSIKHLQKKRS
jgi:hypothetical protein